MALTEQEQKYFASGGTIEITEAVEPAASPEPTPEPTPEPKPEQVTAVLESQGNGKVTDAEHSKSDPPEVALEKVNRALREARNEARQHRAQVQQLQAQQQEFMRRMQEAQAKIAPEQQVTMETDPAEYLKQKVETTEQELARIKQEGTFRAQWAQFQQWYGTKAQEFRSQQPDFDDAYAHYNRARVEQLQETGMTAEQAAKRLQLEEVKLVETAAHAGINPAQMVYQLAHARGYKPAAPASKPQDSAAKLQQISKGVELSKPMASVGGGGQSTHLTWEMGANIPSGPAFKEWWSKMAKQEGLE